MAQTSSGVKIWRLKAPRAQIDVSGHARIDSPDIDFYKEGKLSSHAQSKEASVLQDAKTVLLFGNVLVVSAQEKSTLKTEHLVYDGKTKRFHTDDPVTMERPGGILHGRGLDADSSLSEINIYHQESVLQ